MPDLNPVTTTPNTQNSVPKSGVPGAAVPPNQALTDKPDAKKVETPNVATQPPGVNPEKAAVNQGEAAIKKFKLKIDGEELELPESEVIARAQKYSAADKRFLEAQQTRQQAEEFVNLLRTDFTKLLDDPRLALDETQKRQMLENYYKEKYIDPEVLTPEQREQKKRDQELNQFREEKKLRERQEHNERLRQLEEYHAQNYQKIVMTALQSEGIPKTEYTVRRMAELMSKNNQLGLELTPEHLAVLVREDYQNEIKSVLGASDGDTLLKLLGDDITNKMRKADLVRLRAGQPQVPAPVLETPSTNAPQAQRKFQSMDEMRAERDRKAQELQASWGKK